MLGIIDFTMNAMALQFMALLFSLTVFVTAETASGKNLLFIMFDDLRPELSIYGHDYMITPNFERLAKRSVVFDYAFCKYLWEWEVKVKCVVGCVFVYVCVRVCNDFCNDCDDDPCPTQSTMWHNRSNPCVQSITQFTSHWSPPRYSWRIWYVKRSCLMYLVHTHRIHRIY